MLPLFVLDDGIARTRYGAAANRRAFLREALADLDASLRALGGALDVRRGDVVAETVRAAREVGADDGVRDRRRQPLRASSASGGSRPRSTCACSTARSSSRQGRCADRRTTTTRCSRLPPGVVAGAVRGPPARDPGRDPRCPPGVEPGAWRRFVSNRTKSLRRRASARGSSGPARGCATHLEGYGSGGHDALAADATSRLSPYLHFGCVSARALAVRARERGGDAFVRQLCWRDFYAQILLAQPRTQGEDMRPRGDRWVDDAGRRSPPGRRG